jgi:two-component system, NtrC family, response regulator HydG
VIPAPMPFSMDLSSLSGEEQRAALARLSLLYNLGFEISSDRDPDGVFGTILNAATRLLGAERGFIAVLRDGVLVPRASKGIELPSRLESWPVSRTMIAKVVERGESILVGDAGNDPDYASARSVELHRIRSVLCCPLGLRRSPKGLIYLDNRGTGGAFTRWDMAFLDALSHFATTAMENAEERTRLMATLDVAEARWQTFSADISPASDMVTVSPVMTKLYATATRAAKSDIPIMLVGETGTGKEVFARLIHRSSARKEGPFVAVHVGSLVLSVVESELFGHERGAFTGADRRRAGRFELAKGGELFFDEVLDTPLEVQSKLLRVLEEKTFERVGGNESIHADVRVVCACNRSPEEMVERGLFRKDLYFRLNAVRLDIPPLRERTEDVIPLVRHFLARCSSTKTFTDEALACLAQYTWPGNVRELRNTVEALDALVEGPVVAIEHLPDRMRGGSLPSNCLESLADILAQTERSYIQRVQTITGGDTEQAIKILGVSRATFYQRKKDYDL